MNRHAIQAEWKAGTKLYKVAESISPAGYQASDEGLHILSLRFFK